MQYKSPTVGLHIPAQDYVKFCSNLSYYLSLDPIPYTDNTYNSHLKAKIGDVTLEFVHYKDINTAIEKWQRRKKRVVWDNIILKFEDSYGEGQICNGDTLKSFSKLPYKKVLFYSFNDSAKEYPFAYYLPDHDDRGFIADEFRQSAKVFHLKDLKKLINQ